MKKKIPSNSLFLLTRNNNSKPFAGIEFPAETTVSYDVLEKNALNDNGQQLHENSPLELFYSKIEERLKQNLFTVAEITEPSRVMRQHLLEICNHYYFHPAMAIFTGENEPAPSARSIKKINDEGFHDILVITPEDRDKITVEITPIKAIDKTPPPFDIIGDIHGCLDELKKLFQRLGYIEKNNIFTHPEGRTPIFIGDLTDRGPKSIETMETALNMVEGKKALYIPGNHCVKLARYMEGRPIHVKFGVETTLKEFEQLNPAQLEDLSARFIKMVENSPYYLILDNGKLVISHGGIKDNMIGREHKRIAKFCLFGASTGKTLENGLPERLDWAKNYSGEALVVYGHTPVKNPEFRFNTINIDQGCVFGGALTALRYPEMETISIPARKTYYHRP